jgi:hypothetical protein
MKTSYTILSLSFLFGYAAACGGFFCEPNRSVVQSGEAIVFGVKDRHVSMHVLINYEGPAEDFSWLLPVMFEPTLTTSSIPFFQRMFTQTLPQFRFTVNSQDSETCQDDETPECPTGVPPGAGADGGVEVKEGNVGPFDYTIIKAIDKDTAAVLDWLSTNGYDEYAGSADIINHYVESDHYFMALRLKKDTDSGDLVPIAIEYEMPDDMDVVVCIPLILTGVAAIHAYPRPHFG